MNIPVRFPLAKLLKEKGFDENCRFGYSGLFEPHHISLIEFGCLQRNSELLKLTYTAPTIADVVMWLYERHSIWISVYQYKDHAADNNDPILFRSKITGRNEWLNESNTPKEAYEAAIEYVLNNTMFDTPQTTKKS